MSLKLGPIRRPSESARVGTYGCSAGGGRVVRVTLAGEVKRPPPSARVECPACGYEHPVSITWRRPVDADADRLPDLTLEPDHEP